MQELQAQLDAERRQASEWRELAMRNAPPTPQPANERAFSYQAQNSEPQFPDAALAIDNPNAYNAQLREYITYSNNRAVETAAGSVMPQLAEAGRFMSANDPEYRDVWGKYSSEIEQEMVRNNVPPHMRTKQAWDLVAGMVRGKHYRELGDEWANQRIASGGLGLESGSNAGSVTVSTPDTVATFLTSDHPEAQRLRARGIEPSSVRKYIANAGITEQQWVEDVSKGRSFGAEA
jgi:hypothetical protein